MSPVPITFRLATPDDVAVVVDLVESAYRGERSKAGWTTEADLLKGQRTDPELIAGVIATSNSSLLVATDEHAQAIGCCVIERRDAGRAYFGTFAVRPGLQGGGIGQQLLAEAERIAREDWGATTVEMTVIAQREELIAWYVKRGYAPTGETRPFPYGDERFGLPQIDDLYFVVLAKSL
jgi:ribosomal protein S18 acetylase RimI-like enzyme